MYFENLICLILQSLLSTAGLCCFCVVLMFDEDLIMCITMVYCSYFIGETSNIFLFYIPF